MNPTSAEIYKSILYRAADIYDVDYADVERDIGQQFDPLVRFMSGAMASELEKVYQELEATEMRLQSRLAKVLLPEYYHLPQPAHALATAVAQNGPIVLSEQTTFCVDSAEKEINDIAFAPLFPVRILPAQIALIATDQILLSSNQNKRIRRSAIKKVSQVQKLLIGIEASQSIANWQGTSLFFDLSGTDIGNTDKALFFAAIRDSTCAFHGNELFLRNGLPSNGLYLEDHINGNERGQNLVRARYEKNFLTFVDSDVPKVEPIPTDVRLNDWYGQNGIPEEEAAKIISKIDGQANAPLFWLEIHFSKPVGIDQVVERLKVRLNVFPVINRRLNGNEKGGHHYLRDNSIKWVSLKPKEDFLSIHNVYEEKPPEYPQFLFKPFADFKEERIPSYTLRFGGVGRWDEYNAWERLSYIVRVLSENNRQEEIIEAAASALSLEEIHQLLGKKISKNAADEKPTRDIYVLLHSGVASALRVRVEYWTCIGSEANNIPAKTRLKCLSKEKSNFTKNSIELISTSSDGRGPLNSTEQLDAMKSTLLSRGRIVTREDVKGYCRTMLNDRLKSISVSDSVGVDPRFNFGMTRNLKVILTPATHSRNEDWEGICTQLQKLLEENSTASIPIVVEMENTEKS